MDERKADAYAMPGYGRTETIDGTDPLCGELISWRHPTFGNYAYEEIAASFVNAHTGEYYREKHSGFSCLIWTLSEQSEWMPDKIKNAICDGFKENTFCWSHGLDRDYNSQRDNKFLERFLYKTKSSFRYTREVKLGLEDLVKEVHNQLNLPETPEDLARKFMEMGYVDSYFDEQTRLRKARVK